jgi:hypothetical protein
VVRFGDVVYGLHVVGEAVPRGDFGCIFRLEHFEDGVCSPLRDRLRYAFVVWHQDQPGVILGIRLLQLMNGQ